jgi:hypothetical protein
VGNLFTGVATFIIISLANSIVVEQHPSRNMPLCLLGATCATTVLYVPSLAGWAASSSDVGSFMMWRAIALVGKELCL